MAHLISQGSFLARAVTGSFGLDSKGRTAARVELELLAGPDTGQRITYTGLVNAKSAPYVGKDLKGIGWKGIDLATLEADVSATHMEAQIEIDHKNANDPREPNRVFAVVRSIGRGALPLGKPSASALEDANQAMRAAMGEPAAGGGSKDDDLPFASCSIGHEPSAIARVLRGAL